MCLTTLKNQEEAFKRVNRNLFPGPQASVF